MKTSCEIRKFTASDGYAFHYRHWTPATPAPRGFVVALHGIQSHSGWYEYSSTRLADAGYDVRFLDRRGSGLNGRGRGHAPHPSRLLHDVVQFINDVRSYRDKCALSAPVVLLGISWSAKVAAAIAAAQGELIDALALLYPGICSRVRVNWHQRLRLRLANALGLRAKHICIPLDDPALFTAVPEWQEFIRDDALALHETTIAFLNASLDLDRLAFDAPEAIRVPVLVMLAGRDRIIDNRATRRYVGSMASHHCTVVEYAQAAHTLEFEPNRERILDDLIEWLSLAPRRNTARSGGRESSVLSPPHFDVSGFSSASSTARRAL